MSYMYCKPNISKIIVLRLLQSMCTVSPRNIRFCFTRKSSTSLNSLDDYTSHLVKEKSAKWARMARKTNISALLEEHVKEQIPTEQSDLSAHVGLKTMTASHIDNLLSNAMDLQHTSDLEYIIEQCIKYDKMPSIKIFFELLSYFSKRGSKKEVKALQVLLRKLERSIYEENAALNHFWAEALWMQGNIEEATKIFINLYSENPHLQLKILDMVEYLVSETVCKGSEANLVMMTQLAKTFISKFNEYQLLCSIWELCFKSDWHSDHLWANELMKNNIALAKMLEHRFLPLAIYCLHKHEVNTVHRILEVLLANKMRAQYIRLLHVLFDYKCWRQDLRGCTEIMNTALAQGVPLCASHQEKFLQLLLGNARPSVNPPKSKIPVPRYTLKF